MHPARITLLHFWAYVRRPVYYAVNTSPTAGIWPTIKTLFCVKLGLMLTAVSVAAVFLLPLEKLLGLNLGQEHDTDGWFIFFGFVVIAPLLEETIFRLALRPARNRFLLVVAGMTLEIGLRIRFQTTGRQTWLYGGLCLVLAIAAGLAVYHGWRHIESFWQRQYRWIYYVSSFGFGLAHLFNCDSLTAWHLLFAVLITLPQLVGGLFMGYVRMMYGFWYAVAIHAMNNAVPATIGLIGWLW